MVYVTSDLHGYALNKFKLLLDKAGFGQDDFLFVIGDVIDRGNDGVELLKWMMVQPNVQLIMGNHEAMMLSCSFLMDEITEDAVDRLNSYRLRLLTTWKLNGGRTTLDGLVKEDPETRADILDYIRDCPLYDSVSVGGRDFLLVHAGLGNYEKGKKIDEYSESELLWMRPTIVDRYSSKFTTIFGHTPTVHYGRQYRGRAIKTDTWINVDSGAACGFAPMLLRLDDMKEFYADESVD